MIRSLLRRLRCDALSYVYVMNLYPIGSAVRLIRNGFPIIDFSALRHSLFKRELQCIWEFYLSYLFSFPLCLYLILHLFMYSYFFPSLGFFFSPVMLCWRVIRRSWIKLDLWNALYYIHRNWYFICVCMQDKSASIQYLILEMSTIICVDNAT